VKIRDVARNGMGGVMANETGGSRISCKSSWLAYPWHVESQLITARKKRKAGAAAAYAARNAALASLRGGAAKNRQRIGGNEMASMAVVS